MSEKEYVIRYKIITNKFYCLNDSNYEEVYFYHTDRNEKSLMELVLDLSRDIQSDFEFDFKIHGVKAGNFIAINLNEQEVLQLITKAFQRDL